MAPCLLGAHTCDHSQAMATANTPTSAAHQVPPSHTAPIASGSSTAAETIRVASPCPPDCPPAGLAPSASGAIPAVAAVVLPDRKFQIVPGEVGPEPVEEDQFGIGALPEQKIADPLFAAGADQQIRIGNSG